MDQNLGCPITAANRSTIRLSPVQVPKASDVFANELRERILSGEYVEGTPLPPERELVVQTRMSRATVREALRVLKVQGLVRTVTHHEGVVDDEVRAVAAQAHRSVTRAIRERDPDAAVRRMSRHVHSYAAAALEDDERPRSWGRARGQTTSTSTRVSENVGALPRSAKRNGFTALTVESSLAFLRHVPIGDIATPGAMSSLIVASAMYWPRSL